MDWELFPLQEDVPLPHSRSRWSSSDLSVNADLPAGWDLEVESLWLPVDGGDGPGDADAEEHVDSVGARHVAHRVVCSLVTDGSHFRGEGICAREGEERFGMSSCFRHVWFLAIDDRSLGTTPSEKMSVQPRAAFFMQQSKVF